MPGKKNLRMKAARAAAGLSQADLAQAVGVTRQTIGLIEAGGYNPTLNLCVAICKALHVTLNDLFWEDGVDVDPNAREREDLQDWLLSAFVGHVDDSFLRNFGSSGCVGSQRCQRNTASLCNAV